MQELFLPNWHEHHSACGEKEGEANLVDIGVTHLVLTETIHAGGHSAAGDEKNVLTSWMNTKPTT